MADSPLPDDSTRPATTDALARAEAFGVDLTLLHERLAASPAERLRRHQQALTRAEAVRRAVRQT